MTVMNKDLSDIIIKLSLGNFNYLYMPIGNPVHIVIQALSTGCKYICASSVDLLEESTIFITAKIHDGETLEYTQRQVMLGTDTTGESRRAVYSCRKTMTVLSVPTVEERDELILRLKFFVSVHHVLHKGSRNTHSVLAHYQFFYLLSSNPQNTLMCPDSCTSYGICWSHNGAVWYLYLEDKSRGR